MNTIRMGLFCALVGWMTADAQAQWGTYGSPDPIPLGQCAPQNSSPLPVANRTSYVTAADASGPTLSAAPSPSNMPQPPTESSAVAGMLSQPGTTGCSVMPTGGSFKDAGNCDARGNVCCDGNGCCSRWYASFEGLYMTRNKPTPVYTSADVSCPTMLGAFNEQNWTWGAELTLGYRFGCNCEWGLEGTYWNLAESSTHGEPENIGSCPYVSPMNFNSVLLLGTTGCPCTPQNPNGCQTAQQWINNSPGNFIFLNWNAQDMELNLTRRLCGGDCNCCNPFSVNFLTGVRWFRFQDGFLFSAQRQMDGSGYDATWLYLDDRITNDLVGFQAGFNAKYRFADCWKVFVKPEFGVFNNHTTLNYNLYAESCPTA